MQIPGSPGGKAGSGMQEELHQTEDSGVMDFNSRDPSLATDNGQSQTLEERKIDMDLEALSLKGAKAIDDGPEFGAHRSPMLDALLQEEVLEVIATDLMA